MNEIEWAIFVSFLWTTVLVFILAGEIGKLKEQIKKLKEAKKK